MWAAIEALTLFGNFPDLYGEPTLIRPVRVLSRPSASTYFDLRANLLQLTSPIGIDEFGHVNENGGPQTIRHDQGLRPVPRTASKGIDAHLTVLLLPGFEKQVGVPHLLRPEFSVISEWFVVRYQYIS